MVLGFRNGFFALEFHVFGDHVESMDLGRLRRVLFCVGGFDILNDVGDAQMHFNIGMSDIFEDFDLLNQLLNLHPVSDDAFAQGHMEALEPFSDEVFRTRLRIAFWLWVLVAKYFDLVNRNQEVVNCVYGRDHLI